MFLLTDLAVMVTSGLEVASKWPISSMDLDLAAAANTSAMLLLKVNGMAEELEVSPLLLNSWLLLDLDEEPLDDDIAFDVLLIPPTKEV